MGVAGVYEIREVKNGGYPVGLQRVGGFGRASQVGSQVRGRGVHGTFAAVQCI